MKPSEIIAKNIKKLREIQNLTQLQLATKSKIPRSTLATIESGESSPSIDTLLKITESLSVTLDELVSKTRPKTTLIRAKDISKQKKADGAIIQRKLIPDPIYGMEIDHLILKPNSRMRGVPHIKDTREYFSCLNGEVEIYCDGEKFSLRKGDVLAFPGDRPHSYYNKGKKDAEGFSVIVLAKLA